MMIHEITEKVGRHKKRKRVGRGPGSGLGKTCGRGHKGAGSRAGYSKKAAHEGGQMAFFRRIPKRGFTNSMFRTDYAIVNIQDLAMRFEDGGEVNPDMLVKAGLIRNSKDPVKVLDQGELSIKLNVTAAKFSESAKAKITAAGGSVIEA
ncbi:MAG TPA: 50S ribosomal protein L15 [Phycisphaerales bacterium]|nr:50S ribosomal protein L15 [Phycisphaerales bacterium]